MNHLVSVLVINFNNALWVKETLDSIKAQTYKNFEIVIVDDCSTDLSIEIIEQWIAEHPNLAIKFIKNPVNKGVCKNCNIAIENSSGQYISFIASDDTMMPQKLEKQVEILKNSSEKVCAVMSDAYLMDEESKPIEGAFIIHHKSKLKEIPSGDIYNELLDGNYIPAMSILYKKSHLEQVGYFDEDLFYEDYDMLLRLAKEFDWIYSDYISVKYRMVYKGISKNTVEKKWNYANIKIFLKHSENPITLNKIKILAKRSIQLNDSLTLDTLFSSKEIMKNNNFKMLKFLNFLYLPILIKHYLARILFKFK